MTPTVAEWTYCAGIALLFYLSRESETRLDPALLLPFVWLWVSSSRSITEWLAIIQTGHLPSGIDKATSYAEGTPLDRNILIIMMVLSAIVLIKRRQLVPIVSSNLVIVIFYVYAGFSVIWSDFPDITIRRWFKAVACLLAAMLVVGQQNRDSAMRRLFAWGGLFLIPLSVLFIKYFPAIGRMTIIENISSWVLSPTGVTSHKNSLGGICQFYGITFVWYLLSAYRDRSQTRRRWRIMAYGVALGMSIWLFVQANSVTAQSSFMLVVLFLLATSFPWVLDKNGSFTCHVPLSSLCPFQYSSWELARVRSRLWGGIQH